MWKMKMVVAAIERERETGKVGDEWEKLEKEKEGDGKTKLGKIRKIKLGKVGDLGGKWNLGECGKGNQWGMGFGKVGESNLGEK